MPLPALPKTLLAVALGGLVAATPALAHHPMGGATPATFVQGLLSGLGHPVIGLDHLAALVGIGLVSSRFARGLTLPAFWIVAMAAGVGLHLAGAGLPATEVLVALSVVAIGLAASVRTTLPYGAVALLFAAGGAMHGYALGEAVVGAEAAPIVAYLAGLAAIQVALATGRPASFEGAAQAVREVLGPSLQAAGVSPDAVALVDGSGLSRLNRLQPAAVSRLLARAAADDGSADVERLQPVLSGLPVGGFSGTLEDRYRESAAALPAAGVLRAKTGTLEGVSALAGLLRTADGRLLAFDLTADAVPPGANRQAEAALDALAGALAGCGCR